MNTVQVELHLEDSLLLKLCLMAHENNETLNACVNRVLREYIARLESQNVPDLCNSEPSKLGLTEEEHKEALRLSLCFSYFLVTHFTVQGPQEAFFDVPAEFSPKAQEAVRNAFRSRCIIVPYFGEKAYELPIVWRVQPQ